MFKKCLTLTAGHLFRYAYGLNSKRAVYLMTKYLDKSNLLDSMKFKPISLASKTYAKSRDIKKERKKNIKINENELAEYFDIDKLKQDFVKPVEYFKSMLVEHASVRSSQNAIESLKVPFEGKTYTIQDLAQVGKKTARMYVLDFSSFPQTIQAAMQVIQSSELNINAQQDGTKVFVPIPKVTKEHRELLIKKCKGYFNNCKDTLRQVQNNYIKNLKNQEGITQDEKFGLQEQLFAMTEKHAKQAEEILKAKQAELLAEDKS